MKHVVLLLALLLCIPTAIALDIPVKNSSTDDVGGINTPTQLVNGDMVKMDFKITIGTQPLNGQIMLKVPPGWPLPQSDNSSLDNYTVAVKAQGTTGSVTSFYSKDDTIIANISNGQSNDLFYINYGVGQSVRVPYNFGYYDFHLQINRNGTFEDVQNSPISVEVAPGDWTRTLVLFPGESHLPASVEGIGGIRDDIRTGELVNVTFLAVDLASNIVSVNSTFEFGIFVSNPFAYPPSGYVEPLTLVNGVGQGQVTYNLAGENYLSIIDQNLADIANYTLSVLPGPFEKVISLLPHQTISPGDENSQGRTGIARTWIAGVPMPVKVHATDRFFNIQHGYHGDFTAIFTDSSNNTISVNGQFIDGNGSFTVILPSKDTYELNCTHATAHDVNDVPALLGGILRKGSDDMTAEIDQIAGPFEVILEDEFGNPFEGGAVEFALSPALQGQYLLVNSSLTTGNGAAQSMVHTGKMLGTYNIEATCGQVSNSPVSFNISVIDLTPPTSWVTTENLTVGPNFSIGFDYQDHGGGNVQFVELLFSTKEAWFPLKRAESAIMESRMFDINWTGPWGKVMFKVIAVDDSNNRQNEMVNMVTLFIDGTSPSLIGNTLPAYTKSGTVHFQMEFDEKVVEIGTLLVDGTPYGPFDVAHLTDYVKEISFQTGMLSEGMHHISVDGITDMWQNRGGAYVGNMVVDNTPPRAVLLFDEPGVPLGKGPFSFYWDCQDEWGLENIALMVDNGNEKVAIDAKRGGIYLLEVDEGWKYLRFEYSLSDLAGNTLEYQSSQYPVDTDFPIIESYFWEFHARSGTWKLTANASDLFGISRVVASYRVIGGTAWHETDMARSDDRFVLVSKLGGEKAHEVVITVFDNAHPPNRNFVTFTTYVEDEISTMWHSPVETFVPNKKTILSVTANFEAHTGLCHYRIGGGAWMEEPLTGGPIRWQCDITVNDIAKVEYYFVLDGQDMYAILPKGSGEHFQLTPVIPASAIYTLPRQDNPSSDGVLEIYFPVYMNRTSVEKRIRIAEDGSLRWDTHENGDIMVVIFKGRGEHSVFIEKGALSKEGYVLNDDFAARGVIAGDAEDDTHDLGILLIIGAFLLLFLLAMSIVLLGKHAKGLNKNDNVMEKEE